MLRIGEFARRTGVTIKALRHYDRLGLLRPGFTDPATGYRSYGPDQFGQAERIRKYRGLGFTLAEVRHLLREDGAADLRRLVEARESLLRRELAGMQRQLAALAAWRRSLESRDPRAFPIALREVPARQVVSLRRVLPDCAGVDALLAEMRDALPERAAVLGQGAVWHKVNTDAGPAGCEALLFVAGGVRVPPGYRRYAMAPALVASVLHDESQPNAFPGVYPYTRAHVKPLGYRVQCPVREVYLEPGGNGFALTEIQFRLQRRPPRGTAAEEASC